MDEEEDGSLRQLQLAARKEEEMAKKILGRREGGRKVSVAADFLRNTGR